MATHAYTLMPNIADPDQTAPNTYFLEEYKDFLVKDKGINEHLVPSILFPLLSVLEVKLV